MKLDAAQEYLNKNRQVVDKTFEVVENLKKIREQLVGLQTALNKMR